MLEHDQFRGESFDMNFMPPDDDNITDEDSDDEEGPGPKDPNHLGKGLLA